MKSYITLIGFLILLNVFSEIELGKVLDSKRNHIYRFRRNSVISNVSCTLPPHPKNGRWILINGNRQEEKISIYSILEFHCGRGYKLSSSSPYVICDRVGNLSSIPKCLKLCPPLYSTPTTILKCTNDEGKEVGCHEATQDTYLSYTCAPFYEDPLGFKTNLCWDGDWNIVTIPTCQPVCGKKIDVETMPLIYGGRVEKVIQYPWAAVLYKKENDRYINSCGGSIISHRIVLTAAHCVTNDYGDPLPNNIFMIAGGKLYSTFNDSKDTNAQYLEISKVVVHPSYRGSSRRYLADIAILIARTSFSLSKSIQPVCFTDLRNIGLQIGSIGIVPGFGLTEDDEPSEVLRTLEIPYKSEAACAAELPTDWGDRYNVIDKLCAGIYNQNKSICRGDSGNGLFFKNPDNNRYYIHGIVSLGLSNKGKCNVQQNSLYTNVAYHYDFVDREIIKYYVQNCSLPSHPENGQWTAENGDLKPGDIVRPKTHLEITCEDGYELSSDNSRITCESAFLMPQCRRVGPKTTVSMDIDGSCKNKEGEKIPCREATNRSVLTVKYPLHSGSIDNRNTTNCRNDTWASFVTCTANAEDTPTRIVCAYDGERDYGGDKLNISLCTHILYYSVNISANGRLLLPQSNASFINVAKMKRRNSRLKIILNVEDVINNIRSTVAEAPAKRLIFITDIISFLRRYNFDGVNIYWSQYPHSFYKERYISLLKDIRKAYEENPTWILTTTVRSSYILTNVPPELFTSRLVDWINVQCYYLTSESHRTFGYFTSQTVPLYPTSKQSDFEQQWYNLQGCIKKWKPYLYKKNKISIDFPLFGSHFTLNSEENHNVSAPSSWYNKISDYAKICQLSSNWSTEWDDEQKTPYKYYKREWIGYDDKESIKIKAAYLAQQGGFGVTVTTVDKDDIDGVCGPKQVLLKYIHLGLGNPVNLNDTEDRIR